MRIREDEDLQKRPARATRVLQRLAVSDNTRNQYTDESKKLVRGIIQWGCKYELLYKFAIPEYLKESKHAQLATLYNSNVKVNFSQCVDICLETIDQSDSHKWFKYRKMRITASICYSLYTYHNGNHDSHAWFKKLCSVFKSAFKGNTDTQFGKENESAVRKKYAELTSAVVQEIGLVVLPHIPWLGYSPDGVIFSNGKVDKIIEIKCVVRERQPLKDLILAGKVKNVILENDCFVPNRRHKHFAQCQLGMALCNSKLCDLVIFVNGKVEIIPVTREEKYVEALIDTLNKVYFRCVLPFLADS